MHAFTAPSVAFRHHDIMMTHSFISSSFHHFFHIVLYMFLLFWSLSSPKQNQATECSPFGKEILAKQIQSNRRRRYVLQDRWHILSLLLTSQPTSQLRHWLKGIEGFTLHAMFSFPKSINLEQLFSKEEEPSSAARASSNAKVQFGYFLSSMICQFPPTDQLSPIIQQSPTRKGEV